MGGNFQNTIYSFVKTRRSFWSREIEAKMQVEVVFILIA